MKYKTELHCHSAPVSSCASATPEELVELFVAEGYTTLVLTNHLSRFTYKCKAKGDLSHWPWETKIDYYMQGYYDLCRAAEGRLNILFGCEFRSNIDENDYLIYGLDESFLRENENLFDLKTAEISALLREMGYLFVQAHPFRNGMQITKPELLDGIEVFNGNPKQDSRNDVARMWAERFSLLQTSGSDCHHIIDGSTTGGILTDFPINSNAQLLEVLLSGNYELVKNNDMPK